MKLYLLGFVGVLIHFLVKLINARSKGDFKFSIFIKKTWLSYLLTFVCAMVAIYLIGKPSQDYDIYVKALVAGYTGSSFIKNVLKRPVENDFYNKYYQSDSKLSDLTKD